MIPNGADGDQEGRTSNVPRHHNPPGSPLRWYNTLQAIGSLVRTSDSTRHATRSEVDQGPSSDALGSRWLRDLDGSGI